MVQLITPIDDTQDISNGTFELLARMPLNRSIKVLQLLGGRSAAANYWRFVVASAHGEGS